MATCYRHSSRETGVSCSNCGRPICPDCMTPTPVGMRCPECARQRQKVRTAPTMNRGGTGAEVTRALIAVNVIAFLGELASGTGLALGAAGGTVVQRGGLDAADISVHHEYWRLITSGFLHAGVIHIALNMWVLWVLGQMLEPALGRVRFLVVYFVSLLAGSFGALLAQPHALTVGASGAVFGLFGAAFVEMRARGLNPFAGGLFGSIGGIIIINLIFSFAVSGISWGGHLGGMFGGGLAMLALRTGDRYRSEVAAYAGCLALAAVAVAGAILAAHAYQPVGIPG